MIRILRIILLIAGVSGAYTTNGLSTPPRSIKTELDSMINSVGPPDVRALRRGPRQAEVDSLIQEVTQQIGMGNLKGAISHIDTIMEIDPHRPISAYDIQFVPLVAQAHMENGRFGEAARAFRAYFRSLSPQERALYEDISLVGTPDEVEVFNTLQGKELLFFLRGFWARRDMDLVAGINRRLMEHYRRVWVAQTQFSNYQIPWDRRGEIYIRYGEPYLRQGWGDPEYQRAMDPKVQAVRHRMATRLYGLAVMDGGGSAGFGLENMQSLLSVLSGSIKESGTFSDPIDPSLNLHGGIFQQVPSSMVLVKGPVYPLQNSGHGYTIVGAGGTAGVDWESWVYPYIDGGIEIVFTDESGRGNYDFAPIPTINIPGEYRKSRLWRTFNTEIRRNAPDQVVRGLKSKAPSIYIPGGITEPLLSFLAATDFRGGEDGTRVEVYFGVPAEEVSTQDKEWIGERTMVIYDSWWREIHRSFDRSKISALYGPDAEILDMVSIDLPPGDYAMAVKLMDFSSKRSQLFRGGLRVPRYGEDSLKVSGIEIARQIDPSVKEGKFVKHGLRVIPKPSLSFGRDQDVFVYFEVYNLQRNVHGITHYRVDYTLQRQRGKRGNRLLAGLKWLVRRNGKGEMTTVSHEGEGRDIQEVVHTALDMRNKKKGDYNLQVRLTDLNSGMTSERQTTFSVE